MTEYAINWLAAFVLTLVVEVPVYAALSPGGRVRGAWVGASASVLTHPALWFVVVPNIPWHEGTHVLAEAVISITEGVWWWAWWRRHTTLWCALAVGLAANVASSMLGIILAPFVHWF